MRLSFLSLIAAVVAGSHHTVVAADADADLEQRLRVTEAKLEALERWLGATVVQQGEAIERLNARLGPAPHASAADEAPPATPTAEDGRRTYDDLPGVTPVTAKLWGLKHRS